MATKKEAQLLLTAVKSGITSPKELANFMAQISHESNGLNSLEEGFSYTQGTSQISSKVRSALREGVEALENARLQALHGDPEKLAELMYGGRNGNEQPGDGYKYRGRGYIQLTGRANYQEAGEAMQLDLISHPELAAESETAAMIASFYWNKYVHNVAPEDVYGATLIINGGENGLSDRKNRFDYWEKILTPEVMNSLINSVMPLSLTASSTSHAGLTDRTLRQGALGPEIEVLQKNLNALGITNERGKALTVDGSFGASTREAVEIFQRQGSLTVDGVAGKQTLAAINTLVSDPHSIDMFRQSFQPLGILEPAPGQTPIVGEMPNYLSRMRSGPPVPASQPLCQGERGAAVIALQESLNRLGVMDQSGHPLKIDGIYGGCTQKAVKRFQLWNGLRTDGVADGITLDTIKMQSDLMQALQSTSQPPTEHSSHNLTFSPPNPAEVADSIAQKVGCSHMPPPTSALPIEFINPLGAGDQTHPLHPLYVELKTWLPDASEERLAQFTVACHQNGLSHPDQLANVEVFDRSAFMTPTFAAIGSHTRVDISTPPPTMQESMQQFDTCSRQNPLQAQSHALHHRTELLSQ